MALGVLPRLAYLSSVIKLHIHLVFGLLYKPLFIGDVPRMSKPIMSKGLTTLDILDLGNSLQF